MAEERRKSKRFQSPGLKSNLSDGSSAFPVAIDDVSKTGVSVSQVPEGFDETVRNCFAVINAPPEDFSLILRPCWVGFSNQGKYRRIGFHIDDPPPAWVYFVEGLKKCETGKEAQRVSPRHKILGLMAVISDGKTRYFGVVEDLSASGLRLTHIPADFDESADSCSGVVHSPSGDVHVSLHPCWIRATNKGMYRTIGFRIHNPPPGWQQIIAELEKSGGQLGFLVTGEDEESPPQEGRP